MVLQVHVGNHHAKFSIIKRAQEFSIKLCARYVLHVSFFTQPNKQSDTVKQDAGKRGPDYLDLDRHWQASH